MRDYRLMKRHDADAFTAVKKERSDTLQCWQTDGTEILHVGDGIGPLQSPGNTRSFT